MKIVCKKDNCLNENINQFWDLDTIRISDNETSVYGKFIDSMKFENDHYSVALPFKENCQMLADNYQLCLNRLQKWKERLSKTQQSPNEYNKVFDEYLNLWIMEKVKNKGMVGEVVYLLHKEVIKEDRLTTKLRIVFDESAKYKGKSSLNEVLYKGLCLNADLYSFLLKFQIYLIAITADIEKAYLQISINKEHRDFLWFLWYSNLSEEIISKYRFTRVIFGLTSSQFLLNGIVQSHGIKYEKIDLEFARKVKNHFYIDDLNTGVYSTEGFDFYKKMKVWFMEANFNVRKQQMNDEDLCKLINLYEKNEGINSGVKMNNVHSVNNDKVLGLYWDHKKYIISLKINEVFKEAINIIPTNWNILSVIASVYNLVGYL